MKITYQELRESFLDFFKNVPQFPHTLVPSSSLVPENDPSLLFNNAGMNQFKDFFTGKRMAPYKYACSIQKCVRAGGKHNDLENVGMTPRHHTFFEMMGNFSFGGYFKEEALVMAWNLLTQVWKISPEKLVVSVHEKDQEAYDIWKNKIKISESKIIRRGDKDNFWEMGETGPCGPCSEIFYDHGPEYSDPRAFSFQNILDDEHRFIEIWNVVFMQYEKTPQGLLSPLPNPSIDTGMGLERMLACLQGVYWNYDTDCFYPIIKKLETLCGKSYNDSSYQASFRVCADHFRCASLLVTEGILPGNEGRAYVLRRILRRAIRHLFLLEAPKGTSGALVQSVFEIVGKSYPENKSHLAVAIQALEQEEEKFSETLKQGTSFFEKECQKLSSSFFPPENVFKLYDTYGLPLDLTEILLKEKGLSTNLQEVEQLVEGHRDLSRKSWKGQFNLEKNEWESLVQETGPTTFLGPDLESVKTVAPILKILPHPTNKDQVGFITHTTPFYPEGGGQIGDSGFIYETEEEAKKEKNPLATITQTQRVLPNLIVHWGYLRKEVETPLSLLKNGQEYIWQVNKEKRLDTARNHTATHLLQAALLEVLGPHIGQAGSSVTPSSLRFDFSHPKALTLEEKQQVERLVRIKIMEHIPVTPCLLPKNEALEKGAKAFFEEKYGDTVRVLEIGKFSLELCGGTHVSNTGQIQFFSLLKESSVAAGVRRLEAITGPMAFAMMEKRQQVLQTASQVLQTPEEEVLTSIEELLQTQKNLKEKIEALQQQLLQQKFSALFKQQTTLPNGKADYGKTCLLFLEKEKDQNEYSLRQISDLFFSLFPVGILCLIGAGDQETFPFLLRHQGIEQFSWQEKIKTFFLTHKGKGGGKPNLVQGTIPHSEKESLERFFKREIE